MWGFSELSLNSSCKLIYSFSLVVLFGRAVENGGVENDDRSNQSISQWNRKCTAKFSTWTSFQDLKSFIIIRLSKITKLRFCFRKFQNYLVGRSFIDIISTRAVSLWPNDRICKYIFQVFLKNNPQRVNLVPFPCQVQIFLYHVVRFQDIRYGMRHTMWESILFFANHCVALCLCILNCRNSTPTLTFEIIIYIYILTLLSGMIKRS